MSQMLRTAVPSIIDHELGGVDHVAVSGDAGVGVEGVGLGDSGGVDGPVAGCGGVAAVGDYG